METMDLMIVKLKFECDIYVGNLFDLIMGK